MMAEVRIAMTFDTHVNAARSNSPLHSVFIEKYFASSSRGESSATRRTIYANFVKRPAPLFVSTLLIVRDNCGQSRENVGRTSSLSGAQARKGSHNKFIGSKGRVVSRGDRVII